MLFFDLVALMHDPALPDPDAQPGQDAEDAHPDGQGGTADEAVAEGLLTQVIARYGQLIHAERRAGTEPQRLEELLVQHRDALQDRARLAEADAEEVARLAALYAARLKQLGAS
ncbi:hypothetical protein ACOBQB_10020 [Streptomyces sp. G5(2025)]|uniref:hypothetical protein n=1 Tax=Streptomyces sp. G5(2025) TaxID=3406628 RepID=UPI003C1867CE